MGVGSKQQPSTVAEAIGALAVPETDVLLPATWPLAQRRAEAAVPSAALRIDLWGKTLFGSNFRLIADGLLMTCLSYRGLDRLTPERQCVPAAGV